MRGKSMDFQLLQSYKMPIPVQICVHCMFQTFSDKLKTKGKFHFILGYSTQPWHNAYLTSLSGWHTVPFKYRICCLKRWRHNTNSHTPPAQTAGTAEINSPWLMRFDRDAWDHSNAWTHRSGGRPFTNKTGLTGIFGKRLNYESKTGPAFCLATKKLGQWYLL